MSHTIKSYPLMSTDEREIVIGDLIKLEIVPDLRSIRSVCHIGMLISVDEVLLPGRHTRKMQVWCRDGLHTYHYYDDQDRLWKLSDD